MMVEFDMCSVGGHNFYDNVDWRIILPCKRIFKKVSMQPETINPTMGNSCIIK